MCWLSFLLLVLLPVWRKSEEMRERLLRGGRIGERERGKGRGGGRGRGWGSKKADKGGGRPAGVSPGLLVPHQLHNLHCQQ